MELRENEIEELVERKREGKSYAEIRAELGERGLSEQEIRRAIRKIDEKVLDAELNQKQRSKSNQWYRVGIFIATLGLILTLGANRGIILEGVPKWIVYAPFFAGIVMMLAGRYAKPAPSGPKQSGPGPIRRKRPYK
jgi:hypothetical protein